jgi:hypothetical protein
MITKQNLFLTSGDTAYQLCIDSEVLGIDYYKNIIEFEEKEEDYDEDSGEESYCNYN